MLYRNNRHKIDPTVFYSEDQVKSVVNACGVTIGSDLETHLLVYCPFHYNVNTPACEVDKEKGLFFCFSCQESGSLTDFVMKSTGRNYFEASRLINKKYEPVDLVSSITKIVDKKDIEEFDMDTITRLNNNLNKNSDAKSYLYSRGIDDISISVFKIGFSDKQNMVTVPVQDHTGMYVGFVGRSISDKSFKNSTGLPRRHTLFNLNRSKFENIIVVESSFDAIRLWQLGLPAVATLGSYISKEQIALLNKWANEIIIAPDKDQAGEKLVLKIKNGSNKQINVVSIPGDAKDVGDLEDNQIKDIFDSSSFALV